MVIMAALGFAAKNGTHVTISGGQITGNYSQEAGGGVYITDRCDGAVLARIWHGSTLRGNYCRKRELPI